MAVYLVHHGSDALILHDHEPSRIDALEFAEFSFIMGSFVCSSATWPFELELGGMVQTFMNWATAAAFTAAFLSLANVAYSARLTSRGTREQWRREQERPIVARCITLSGDAADAWHATSRAWLQMTAGQSWRDSEGHEHWRRGRKTIDDLAFEVAQLDLLANGAVREAAGQLLHTHQMAGYQLAEHIDDEETPPSRVFDYAYIMEAREQLIDAARADLGLSRLIASERQRGASSANSSPLAKSVSATGG
jgi:hypothetical protein